MAVRIQMLSVGGNQNLACIEEMYYVSCIMTKN